jgi:hypothetical protein
MTALDAYDALVADLLTRPGVTLGRALSNEGLMVGGKLFAFLRRDRLVVKLPLERVAQVIDDGTAEMAMMGTRTMKQWVELPHEREWPSYAIESYDYVRKLHAT